MCFLVIFGSIFLVVKSFCQFKQSLYLEKGLSVRLSIGKVVGTDED